MSSDVEQQTRGEGVAELVAAILRPADPASGADRRSPLGAPTPLGAKEGARSLPSAPPRSDVVAALIGAEAGAAIGLLWFGWTPLMPIAVTLGAAVAGPLVVRASRPLRMLIFRHWLRSQLSGPAS